MQNKADERRQISGTVRCSKLRDTDSSMLRQRTNEGKEKRLFLRALHILSSVILSLYLVKHKAQCCTVQMIVSMKPTVKILSGI